MERVFLMVSRQELKSRAKAQLGSGIFTSRWMMALLACLLYSLIVGVSSIVAIIVIGPMSYGLNRMFLKQARDGEDMAIGDLFKGFSDDFAGTFLIGLMTAIFTFLWSLLFVIPGIVKAYAYSLAYYVKVDHPEYDWKACIEESKRLTQGHKGELFVLDLSFIGWYFVGALCLGIGTMWVTPYYYATKAHFYQNLLLAQAPAEPYTAE